MFCGSAACTVGRSCSCSGNGEPAAGGWELEAGSCEPAAGGWEPDAGGCKPEAESCEPEAESCKPEAESCEPDAVNSVVDNTAIAAMPALVLRTPGDFISCRAGLGRRRPGSARAPGGSTDRVRRRPAAHAVRTGAARDRFRRAGADADRAAAVPRGRPLRCTA